MILLNAKFRTESSGAEIYVTPYFNPLNLEFDGEKTEDNTYLITVSQPVLNSDLPSKWEIIDGEGNKYALSYINQTQFQLAFYGVTGSPYTSEISSVGITLETF